MLADTDWESVRLRFDGEGPHLAFQKETLGMVYLAILDRT